MLSRPDGRTSRPGWPHRIPIIQVRAVRPLLVSGIMRPDEQLTSDVSLADYVLDTANIVLERTLGGTRKADLGRLLALLEGLAAFSGDASVKVYAVTDESLIHSTLLTAAERATLAGWAAAGLLEVLDDADGRIIEILENAPVRAVTRDNFTGVHRIHPWIPGNADRFLTPYLAPDGRVTVRPRIIPVTTEAQRSRKEEEDQLKENAMLTREGGRRVPREDLLQRHWRCPDDACVLFGPRAPGSGGACPRRRNGEVRCPTHDLALTDLGPRPFQTQIKVRVDGDVVHTFLVVDGAPVTVGRSSQRGGVSLLPWLSEGARLRISRDHVELRYEDRVLTVTNLGREGTRVLTTPERPPVELRTSGPWRLRPGHAVLLHDSVRLEQSGRNYVFEADGWTPDSDTRRAIQREGLQPTMITEPPPAPGRGKRRGRRRGKGGGRR